MLVEFDVELPDELVEKGRILAAKKGTTLEAMLVEHIESMVTGTKRDDEPNAKR